MMRTAKYVLILAIVASSGCKLAGNNSSAVKDYDQGSDSQDASSAELTSLTPACGSVIQGLFAGGDQTGTDVIALRLDDDQNAGTAAVPTVGDGSGVQQACATDPGFAALGF